MTKRIRPFVQSLGAAALVAGVFMFQACGGGNGHDPDPPARRGRPAPAPAPPGRPARPAPPAAAAPPAGGRRRHGRNAGLRRARLPVARSSRAAPAPPRISSSATRPADPRRRASRPRPARRPAPTPRCRAARSIRPRTTPATRSRPRRNTACPAGVTPQGSAACDVPHCVLCNSLGGVTGGSYLDSGGAPKVGWCTCQEPNATGPAHVDLRERHGLAVPAGRRLLSGRT